MAYIIMSYAEIKKTINSDFSTPLNEGGVKIVKSVQRGINTTVGDSAKSVDITISAVDVNKSIVIIEARISTTDDRFKPIGYLTSSTILHLESMEIDSYRDTVTTSWQVIEFY